MKKRLLHLLIPLFASTSDSAADEQHSLIISFHEGDSVGVILADKPQATFIGDSLHVESANCSTTYLRSDISGFHFGWYDPTFTSIGTSPKNMVQIVYTDNTKVLVHGIENPSYIGVYTLDGHRMAAPVTFESDGVAIHLTTCPAGVYIIQINNKQTIKITRR